MQGIFPYEIDVTGFGPVVGRFTAEDGFLDTIELPDGTELTVGRDGVSHEDPLCLALGEAVLSHLRQDRDVNLFALPSTAEPEDWRGHAPVVL